MTYTASAGEDGTYKLTYTGNPVAMGVKSIIAQDAVEAYTPGSNFNEDEVDYIVRYFEDDGDGKFDTDDEQVDDGTKAPVAVGKYFVVAMDETAKNTWKAESNFATANGLVDANGTLTQGVIVQYFEVVPQSLEGAQVVNAAGTSEFTYNGTAQNLNISLDGKILAAGDYNLQILDGNGRDVTGTGAVNAGKYTAVVTGKDGYQNDKVEIPFEVGQLDLSEAVVFAKDLDDNAAPGDLKLTQFVNGVNLNSIWKDINRTQIAYTNDKGKTYGAGDAEFETLAYDKANNALGAYTFRLTPQAGNANVIGTVDFVQNVCDELVADSDFLYDGEQLTSPAPTGLEGRVFDLSEGDAYDASKIAVDGHKASEYTVSLATADAATAGEYTVSVRMNVPSDFSIGGGVSADFTVLNGVIDSSSVEAVLLIDGVNYEFGGEYEAYYVPEGVEPNVTIKAGKTVLSEGEDYDVVYTDSTGAEVEAMVDAGEYTVTVKLKNGYEFSSDDKTVRTLDVVIKQRKLATVSLVEDYVLANGGGDALLYTGSEIAPQFIGSYTDDDGDAHTIVLDSSWYDVTGVMYKAKGAEKFVPAESVLKAGSYEVNMTPAAACKNYTWDDKVMPVKFEVVEAARFADVASDAWYASSVLTASSASFKYMNGLAGTDLFLPLAEISRAEVAQVFYNMAGAPSSTDATNGFADVNEGDWFLKAVSWASAAGIVTGYEGTGSFGPSDKATREQVATMIYRYMKAQGKDVTVSDEAAALAKYSDGASVSEYAKTAMAYCVEQGVFGVDVDTLRPQDNLSRAEMAATSVRVQPDGAYTEL